MKLLAAVALAALLLSGPSRALSPARANTLHGYAVVVGRAAGCGVDTAHAMSRIGKWLDRYIPPRSPDHRRYLPIFMAQVQAAAGQQIAGKSGQTCSEARAGFLWE